MKVLYFSQTPMFRLFSISHIFFIVLPWLIGLGFATLKQKAPKLFGRHIKTMLTILFVVQQFLLYSWYYMNNQFDFHDALPLYPCRLSALLCLFSLAYFNEMVFDVVFYMGLSGASIALIFPDTSHLGFPNAMFIQFFLGHIGIIISIIYLSLEKGYRPSKKGLKRALGVSVLFLLAMALFNQIFHCNYAYMASKPDLAVLNWMPNFPYHIPLLMAFLCFTYVLVHVISLKIQKHVV